MERALPRIRISREYGDVRAGAATSLDGIIKLRFRGRRRRESEMELYICI